MEVCPTGVFTDKTLSAAYNRKWDLRGAPSVCVHCGHGCNIQVSERGGQIRRVLNRFNAQVNGYFLCDRGRFGYGFANDAHRPTVPMVRDASGMVRADAEKTCPRTFGDSVASGAERSSASARRAPRWKRISACANWSAADSFFAGMAAAEAGCVDEILKAYRAGLPTARLDEIETADAVLVLGEDVANTAPRLALALRQAVRSAAHEAADRLKLSPWQDAAIRIAAQEARAPLIIASPFPTPLDDIAHIVLPTTPAQMLDFARALQAALATDAQGDGDVATIARLLLAAKRPVIVAGCALGVKALPASAAMIVQILRARNVDARLAFAVPECNSLGLAMMQAPPIEAALQAAAHPETGAVIVLENDLTRRLAPHDMAAWLGGKKTFVVLDHIPTPTTARADVLLPCTNFAECEGTYVSAEGRAQRGFAVAPPPGEAAPGWAWLRDIAAALGRRTPPPDFDAVTRSLATALPEFSGIEEAAPGASFRIAGQRLRSEPHRYSGRTAMEAARTVHEPQAFEPEAAPFTGTMEGYYGAMPAALFPFFWAPGWNSGQALHKFQDESGALRLGPAGVRLFDKMAATSLAEPAAPPETAPADGTLLLLPQFHVFGSEELSARAAPVAELIQAPALCVSAADAGRFGLRQNMPATLAIGVDTMRLNVNIVTGLSAGIATVSAGWPQTAWLSFPVRATPRSEREEAAP